MKKEKNSWILLILFVESFLLGGWIAELYLSGKIDKIETRTYFSEKRFLSLMQYLMMLQDGK